MLNAINPNHVWGIGIVLAALILVHSISFASSPDSALVQKNDEALQGDLDNQMMDASDRWHGGIRNYMNMYHARETASMLQRSAAAYYSPESKFYKSAELLERMRLAAEFLERTQTADGNVDLMVTNFNSPPDTGFVVHYVVTVAKLAQMHDDEAVANIVKPFLMKAGAGMAKGGVHTPNHRWVVSAALAQIHDVFPNPDYVKRIDQWLAEGIDIDEEGQYSERSTGTYNAVCDYAFITMAHKLKRPELLEPVRKNLDAMSYLLHPNGEVVTVFSKRQDQNTRRTMSGYWFSLRYMAIHDQNGVYASMLKPLEPSSMNLAELMEYPELNKPLSELKPIPDDYHHEYPRSGIIRIRRGKKSCNILGNGSATWLEMRSGDVAINGIRFASAFFGKGQFAPTGWEKRNGAYHFTQKLQGPYYQPITDSKRLPILQDDMLRIKKFRRLSEICILVYEGRVRETADGFEIDIEAKGTDNVPWALEINFRPGGKLEGVEPILHTEDAYVLKGDVATYTVGDSSIEFGPGAVEHTYVELRGSEEKLSGPSVYLTGYTPCKQTLTFTLK